MFSPTVGGRSARLDGRLGYALLLIAATIAPLFIYPIFLATLLSFALFACGYNLLFGFTGLLSFGHAAFFGWAGYAAGYTVASLHWTTGFGLLAGMATGATIGLVFGVLAIRREGIYFAMVTLALSQMLYFFAEQSSFTGGENGLQGVPRSTLLGIDLKNDLAMYYVVLAIFVLSYLFIARVVRSPFGEILNATRENEARAYSLGYEVGRFKLMALVLSASISGLAGAMKCIVLGFTTLSDVHWSMSGLVLLMALIGGKGTLLGPLIGAAIIVSLDTRLENVGSYLAGATGVDWFRQLGRSVTMVTGLIFIACVLGLRGGVAGTLASLRRSPRAKPLD